MTPARYTNPAVIDLLAREFVLGTLHGRARRRFESILSGSIAARRSVAAWEQRLTPLATSESARPPAEAWSNIEKALGRGTHTPIRGAFDWRALAAGCAAATMLFALLYFFRPLDVATPTYVAVVANADSRPLWLLQAFADNGELRISLADAQPPPADSDYELWMLPDDGSAPVSLGLLSATSASVQRLTAQALAILERTSTLAVSIEPAGGSPTGAPTGPVVFTAPLVRS
jgi:anti-sigma-K factor RskA